MVTVHGGLNGAMQSTQSLNGEVTRREKLGGTISIPTRSRGGGTTDYDALSNKPKINSVTLEGNKTGAQLSLVNESDTLQNWEIDQIIYGGL